MTELADFVNPEDRLREQDLVSDQPGRVKDRGRIGNYALGERGTAREEATLRFARQLCGELETGRVAHRFERIHISAAPDFLGLLRQTMSPETRKLVATEINHDIVRLPPAEIRRYFPDRV
jgi:protein required for attachment to host cells